MTTAPEAGDALGAAPHESRPVSPDEAVTRPLPLEPEREVSFPRPDPQPTERVDGIGEPEQTEPLPGPLPEAADQSETRPLPLMHRLALHATAWLVGVLIVAISLGAAWTLVRPQLTKPYAFDEAAFAFAGHAVATTGLPYANVGHLQEDQPGDFSKRFNWALWHPPLYVYTLGWAYYRWGETEQVARMVGVVCNGVATLCVFLVSSLTLWRRTRAAPVYASCAAALYALNPLVIQSALLLDIDGTVLVATVSLLALAYAVLLRSRTRLGHPVTWLLMGVVSFCLALSLWAKMTTALALVVAAALYRLYATRPWRPWRAFVELPVIALAGGGLFLLTWWGFAHLKGMPFWYPFRILQLEFAEAAGSTTTWRQNPRLLLELVSYVALWISPYLLLLFVWAALSRAVDLLVGPPVLFARRLLRRPQRGQAGGGWPIDFALLCGGAIGAAYLIKLAASFPKYHVTMMPFWALAVAYLLYRYVPRLSWWEPAAYGVALAGMVGYFVSFVGDRYVLFSGWNFLFPLIVWPAALGFAFLVLGAALGKTYLPRQLAVLGVLLTLSWSWGVGLAQAQADYSTAYNYGTNGQNQVGAYLSRVLKPGEPYVAAREVAYYASDQVFVDQDTWWATIEQLDKQNVSTFDGRILGYQVNVLALFLWDPTLGAIAHSYLDPNYSVIYQVGPFVVFSRNGP